VGAPSLFSFVLKLPVALDTVGGEIHSLAGGVEAAGSAAAHAAGDVGHWFYPPAASPAPTLMASVNGGQGGRSAAVSRGERRPLSLVTSSSAGGPAPTAGRER
jgi:hypothetical protein